jgi:hypothetical protein
MVCKTELYLWVLSILIIPCTMKNRFIHISKMYFGVLSLFVNINLLILILVGFLQSLNILNLSLVVNVK